ncbi:hypothetical protein K1Y72_17890 [Actinomadura sp. PM05-2]|uniref:Polysaccharide deacetylase n=1 Tax=Actinomadura parmotrematis TaxID=2864039 RepID=A0ABS7FWB0_9ACTN|nr:hypothetical protein [Actinomadura parmotrematis]
MIGDGSTADTGPQPGARRPSVLAPGQRPPQFVVFSWDGAGEDGNRLFSHFRRLGARYGATQTFFLSGLYVLPKSQRMRYRPPGHARGASDIGLFRPADVHRTLDEVRAAWLAGNEIGTHYNGHFCGATGVNAWSAAQWRAEIRQAKWFVEHWRTTTGWTGMRPLPFDYEKELIGGRTPCLEGRAAARAAGRSLGFRYDSSGNGTQVWPDRTQGLWDVPLQRLPMPGRPFEVLSMDYNYMANQPKGGGFGAGEQMRASLMGGFHRAYDGNRAPLIIGNHFEQWNGGVYMDAVESVMRTVCRKPEVRCVSFRHLVDWLDVQRPHVLHELRKLPVGHRPARWPR